MKGSNAGSSIGGVVGIVVAALFGALPAETRHSFWLWLRLSLVGTFSTVQRFLQEDGLLILVVALCILVAICLRASINSGERIAQLEERVEEMQEPYSEEDVA